MDTLIVGVIYTFVCFYIFIAWVVPNIGSLKGNIALVGLVWVLLNFGSYQAAMIYTSIWFLLNLLTSNWIKGKLGERKVTKIIKKTLEDQPYRLINDVTLKTTEGTTQIDHVLLVENRAYIIETKNYSGKIFASENDYYWTQRIGKFSNRFYSPWKQNTGHIKALESYCSNHHVKFINTVVFTDGDVMTRSKLPYGIITLSELPHFIRPRNLNDKKLDAINLEQLIETIRLKPGVMTDIKHVFHLKTYKIRQLIKRFSN